MRMFKGKKEQIPHKLLREYNWKSYDDIPNDFESDTWYFENMNSSRPWGLKKRSKYRLHTFLNRIWFRSLATRFMASVFDLGDGDYESFIKEERYKPRAENLIKNSWIHVPFGIYLIEFSIADGFAYSHYSLNYGVSYSIHMESELTKSKKKNIEILVNLFAETESHLYRTFFNQHTPQSNYISRLFKPW